MSQIGIGAMLHCLDGGSEHAPAEYVGQRIVAAELAETGRDGGDQKLVLTFEDGRKIAIWDAGQSCCESRYMTTDDNVSSLVGHTLQRIEAKEVPTAESDDDCHEQIFVEIGTDQGCITLVNHNEHNGWYGGFDLTITEE